MIQNIPNMNGFRERETVLLEILDVGHGLREQLGRMLRPTTATYS